MDSQSPQTPALTLHGATSASPAEEETVSAQLDESLLTEAERKMVEEFSAKIDVMDSSQVLQYGVAAQKHVAEFSETALSSIRSKDLGEVGQALSQLVVELRGFGDEEEKKGILGLFKKAGNRLEAMKAQYAKVEANVDQIARQLEQHQLTLMKDVAMLDQMYDCLLYTSPSPRDRG